MEYVYAALLIHKAGGSIDEATVTKTLAAAGVSVDDSRVKALVAALDGVDISEAIAKAAVSAAPAAGASAPAADGVAPAAEEKKEEPKEDPNAAAGLGSLFG